MNTINAAAMLLACWLGQGASTQPATAPAGETHVLLVGGIHRDASEAAAKSGVLDQFGRALLDRGGVAAKRVTVLAELGAEIFKTSGLSDAQSLTAELERLATAVGPGDTFIFYYGGQANLVGEQLRLNLPGADMTHEQLVALLRKVPAGRKVIVLDCPCAGIMVKPLAEKGTIILCGARSDQPYSPQFGRYFVPALTDAAADSDADGKVSLLEAFTRASRQVEKSYNDSELLMTEIPLLEDDGDGTPSQQPWAHAETKGDGAAAAQVHLLSPNSQEPAVRPQ